MPQSCGSLATGPWQLPCRDPARLCIHAHVRAVPQQCGSVEVSKRLLFVQTIGSLFAAVKDTFPRPARSLHGHTC
eukprot:351732-Chlamydomonas_euryale.AAC.7